jgi:hypothetical protein
MPGGKQKKIQKREHAEIKHQSKTKKPKRYNIEVKVKKTIIKKPSRKEKLDIKEHQKEPLPHVSSLLVNNEKEEIRAKLIWEKTEREKNLLMWSLVVVFMLIIGSFWAINFRTMFEKTIPEKKSELSIEKWKNMASELDQRVNNMESDLQKIRSFASSTEFSNLANGIQATSTLLNKENISTSTNSVSTSSVLEKEELDKIKAGLKKIK